MRLDDPAYPGQKEYTPAFLRVYDALVLGFFARFIWRCPTPLLVDHYRRHLRRAHLDVGPGTGYFLATAGPSSDTRLTLLDPNPHVLAHAGRRLATWKPETLEGDVLKPLPVDGPFDSVALSYVLHCLPGPQPAKALAIENAARKLTEDGVLFGSTVLGDPAVHTPVSSVALRSNNRRGIFDNLTDTEEGLAEILHPFFEMVEIRRVGSVAIFSASGPRPVAERDR
jgi:SAM-dependent methyltransferase